MWLGKRFFDFFFVLIGLILLSPIFVVISIWIKTTSKGPVFYRQLRVGRNEVPFKIYKFRTMYVDADKRGLLITVGEDARITSCGKILRKFKIDELPQLIDVLLGRMSLVGPRPEVPMYVDKYPQHLRQKVFKIRPGITDWASIEYKDENTILGQAEFPEKAYIEVVLPNKLKYVEKYLDNASLSEDLKIIFLTFFKVFGRGSNG
jgi:lipopolysaccharide/colanic/teichoic acid biosynthesis glycosyltransferase